ncbi:MAG: ferrous iron transport protein A [Rhodospirillaceae bacterium]|jgi:ferrous iron transport protein A|nr:ferrous iron transport protein A [Rhodospirillaceae bacterium]
MKIYPMSTNIICSNLLNNSKDQIIRLGNCKKGWSGIVSNLTFIEGLNIDWYEFEERLLEMGFIENAEVKILYEGLIKHDPIAVLVNETIVAIRRSDALTIIVRPL